jgi:hypothetical protein
MKMANSKRFSCETIRLQTIMFIEKLLQLFNITLVCGISFATFLQYVLWKLHQIMIRTSFLFMGSFWSILLFFRLQCFFTDYIPLHMVITRGMQILSFKCIQCKVHLAFQTGIPHFHLYVCEFVESLEFANVLLLLA